MMETDTDTPPRSTAAWPRSLPIQEWPEADRQAWAAACRPGIHLEPGGSASYLAEVSRGFCTSLRCVLGVPYNVGEASI
jgi:hypothetical protein